MWFPPPKSDWRLSLDYIVASNNDSTILSNHKPDWVSQVLFLFHEGRSQKSTRVWFVFRRYWLWRVKIEVWKALSQSLEPQFSFIWGRRGWLSCGKGWVSHFDHRFIWRVGLEKLILNRYPTKLHLHTDTFTCHRTYPRRPAYPGPCHLLVWFLWKETLCKCDQDKYF